MSISQIVQDINITVYHALAERLHLANEAVLLGRADALLATLPVVGDVSPTTALLLRHYHTQLQAELCQDHQPRARFDSIEAELREITRAVMATMGGDEGLSI